jgi:hypothetical protein
MLIPLCGPGDLKAHLQRHVNAPSQWYYPYHCSFCNSQVELLLANAKKQQGCTCRKGVKHGQHGTLEHDMWERSKRRARKKGFEHTIKYYDIHIPTHCPLLGIPLFRAEGQDGARSNSPSLDRIDSSKGYTPDNIWVISNKANSIKSNATVEELETIAANLRAKIEGRL